MSDTNNQLNHETSSAPQEQKATIFYDSQCPLCQLEMNHLRESGGDQYFQLQDLHTTDFNKRYPHINPAKAYQKLHVELANGDIIQGLDANCHLWLSLGKFRWLKILRYPFIRHIADACYAFFARYRNSISALLAPLINKT